VLSRLTLQLGQMSAKGKVMAQDLNVMAEAGVNARKYIMDAFGMTVDEIQNSGIDVEKVIEAIFKGMERDFGGSAQRMMSSWRGLKETALSYLVEIERKVMDAGAFEGMKAGLKEVNQAMKTWLEQNQGLLQQKVPEYTREVISALKSLAETTSNLVGVYKALPDEVVGAAGYGIIGRMIFGGWGPARIIAGIMLIENTMHDFGMGLQDLKRKNDEAGKAIWDLGVVSYELLAGQRHWWTGQYTEWLKAAEGASDFWQRQKKNAQEYQNDIQRLIERDPLNDFFARQKSQMAYYTSPAAALIRKAAQENAAAAKQYEEQAKKLAEDVKKAQEEFAAALMAPSRIEEAMAGGRHENAILRMEQERLERIREQAREIYGEDGDYITRHREEIGPYDADLVKQNLEEISRQGREASDEWVQLSQRTAEAMQGNFSDLFFDAFTGKLKSLEDYAAAIFESIQRAAADMAGQLATQAIFGGQAVGGTAGGGGLISWLAGLLGSTGGSAAMSQSTALALVRHAGGEADGTGPWRQIPAWMLAAAPRLHNGLAPDEFPAILQRGERVIPKNTRIGQPPSVTINVQAPKGYMDRESLGQVQAAAYTAWARAARRNA